MDTVARPQLQVNDPKYVPTSSQFEDGSSLKLNALKLRRSESMSFADLEATCMDGLTALHDGNIHAKKTNEQRKQLRLALRPYLLRVRDLLSKQANGTTARTCLISDGSLGRAEQACARRLALNRQPYLWRQAEG